MNKTEMKEYLLHLVEDSDMVSGEYIPLSKCHIIQIIYMLSEGNDVQRVPKSTDGQKLFFCSDCCKSFWADPREDKDCFRQWHYHRWYANCPECNREVSQNDRYWR